MSTTLSAHPNPNLGLGRPRSGRGASSCGHPRESSASFKLFDPAQVQVFKEAFSLLDTNSDGYITPSDLSTLLTQLGQPNSEKSIAQLLHSTGLGPEEMMDAKDGGKGINFTMFVTMMASHLSPLSPTSDLSEAFSSFDPTHSGLIRGRDLHALKKCLKDEGDGMSEQEIERLLSGPFMDRDGSFRYRDLCQTLRVTDGGDDE
ncbi:BZ3500_MvSof-1268-A1-R1_Chr7-3g09700 [Microbotryum saponariae]|uniref:BZ3500_MvSof-1268-A1-R1_Chr7-3g09700 protein n=1 Tax=Microbotryum saponariae TaxID=289078 RepID=A0A2X0KV75_9BASI|nr:BZ3501_MvSof-1269-A2-R1_Chr7-2g09423 [Microbotryum saponariae]SDA02439.1 BZ3500_MvSof-1268-A1-R1_Chr7-3g09700 [Microbotryum saponariae]